MEQLHHERPDEQAQSGQEQQIGGDEEQRHDHQREAGDEPETEEPASSRSPQKSLAGIFLGGMRDPPSLPLPQFGHNP
jgi:hypothetical protein